MDDPRIVIDSDAVEVNDDGGVSDPFPALDSYAFQAGQDDSRESTVVSSGDTIDEEFAGAGNESEEEERFPRASSSSRRSPRLRAVTGDDGKRGGNREATGKPPSIDEWMNFFSKIVLRFACNWYLEYAFRNVDEDLLSDRELDRLQLSDEERLRIATPFAELSNSSRFMRKHGRKIVASGDSFQAMVTIGAWMSRVNRIAAKYKGPKPARGTVYQDGNNGQNPQPGSSGPYSQGSTGGRVPNGFPLYHPGSG